MSFYLLMCVFFFNNWIFYLLKWAPFIQSLGICLNLSISICTLFTNVNFPLIFLFPLSKPCWVQAFAYGILAPRLWFGKGITRQCVCVCMCVRLCVYESMPIASETEKCICEFLSLLFFFRNWWSPCHFDIATELNTTFTSMRILGLVPKQRDVLWANRRSAYERYAAMHGVCDGSGIPGAWRFLNAAMCAISVVIMAERNLQCR